VLGCLDAKRDWGYSGDYVKAMWLMLQQEKPDDYVIATGETHSVQEFLQLSCKAAGINDWEAVYKHNPKFDRPAEVDLLIGDPTAEQAKLEIGSAKPLVGEKLETTIRGRDLSSGLPKEVVLTNQEIAKSLDRSLKILIEAIRAVIEETPPELVADIYLKNIWLSGGSGLLRGLDKLIENYCEIPVRLVDDPLTAEVRGTGIILEDLEKYKNLLIKDIFQSLER